jgi:cystathionine beta-lyase/cystathionine gamma-synthase
MSMSRKPPYVVRPSTAVITRGYDPSLSVGSVRPAVFRSSTYVFRSPESAERAFAIALGKLHPTDGEEVDLIYSRVSHPNAEILEDQVAPLEPGAEAAAVFNSGMAAISTILLTSCPPGSAMAYTKPLYGGTQMFLDQMLTPRGVSCAGIRAGDTDDLRRTIAETENLKIVFIETPSNPTVIMSDIAAAVEAAKALPEPPLVVVDNTFLGPIFQHPLSLGADLSVYSATKYLAGFSDMLGGVVLGTNPDLVNLLRGTRVMLGNILQPDECWLLTSRLPTVELRMNRQSKNADRVVAALVEHPKVLEVLHPSTIEDAEQVRIRDAQTLYGGAMIALRVKGGKSGAFEFLRRVRIAHDAVSLGGMETLVCHPATTTHSEMTPEELVEFGVSDDLVRISIGIEDWRDLIEDFKQALDGLPD